MKHGYYDFNTKLGHGQVYYIKNTVTGKGYYCYSHRRLLELREQLDDDYTFFLCKSAENGYSKSKEIRQLAKELGVDPEALGV